MAVAIDENNSQSTCSAVKLNNNDIIISCKELDKYTNIRNNSINVEKININNNNDIDAIIKSLNIVETFDIKQFYNFQFLKDKDNNIILLIDYLDASNERQNGFHAFEYSFYLPKYQKFNIQ